MSKEKSADEKRRDDVEACLMLLSGKHITTDEMGEIFDQARRYRALRNFIENGDLASIEALAVFPEIAERGGDTPAIEGLEVDEDGGEGSIAARYGEQLDRLADFLDANRNAGKSSEQLDVEARLARGGWRGRDA